MWGLLAAAGAKSAFDWYGSKKEAEHRNRMIDEGIESLDKTRDRIPGQNRTAYARALTTILSNRRNPNAGQFAASAYNSDVTRTEQLNDKILQAQSQLRMQRQRVPGMGDLLSNIGTGALNMHLLGKFMNEDGIDNTYETPGWINSIAASMRKTVIPRPDKYAEFMTEEERRSNGIYGGGY